jgi:hypothetical protein
MGEVLHLAQWKVVRTQFKQLEAVLNTAGDQGFCPWELIVLSPEATKSSTFELIVIFHQGNEVAEKKAEMPRLKLDRKGRFAT